MNKKLVVFPFLILTLFIFSGCGPKNIEIKPSLAVNETKVKADKVQIFTFHATNRCATCIAIGKLSGETVEEYYQPELRDGKIEVREINIDLPENREIAEKFQVSGSALFINAIYDKQDHITEDTAVWRLTSNQIQFKSYLKNKIDTLLGK